METSLEIMMELDPVEGRRRETNMEVPTELDPVEGRQRETNQEIMTKQDPIESRRETEGAKPGNHNETRSSKKGRQMETDLDIIGTGSNRRETKGDNGDRPGNHVGTGFSIEGGPVFLPPTRVLKLQDRRRVWIWRSSSSTSRASAEIGRPFFLPQMFDLIYIYIYNAHAHITPMYI